MSADLNQAQAEAALKDLPLPNRPLMLQELEQILSRDNADTRTVALRISRDATLSTTLLTTVNSPLFGLKPPRSSVPQAVQTLGMRNTVSLARALLLRQTLSPAVDHLGLEHHWQDAAAVAAMSAHLATLLPRVVREDAYAFGMFRNAGMVLLLMRWPSYWQTLQDAATDPRPLPALEEERHGTHHAIASLLLARHWGLADSLCQGIQRHHEMQLFIQDQGISGNVLTLIAINRLAEHLQNQMTGKGRDSEWERYGRAVLAHLGFKASDYRDLSGTVSALTGPAAPPGM